MVQLALGRRGPALAHLVLHGDSVCLLRQCARVSQVLCSAALQRSGTDRSLWRCRGVGASVGGGQAPRQTWHTVLPACVTTAALRLRVLQGAGGHAPCSGRHCLHLVAQPGWHPAAAGLEQAGTSAGTLGDAWRQRVPAAAVCPSVTGPVQCCTAAQRYRPLSVALQGCRGPPVCASLLSVVSTHSVSHTQKVDLDCMLGVHDVVCSMRYDEVAR